MSPVCVDKNFIKQKATELNISEAAIERIAHKYINQVGNADALPTDDYILNEYKPQNIVSKNQVDSLLKVWEKTYSSPIKAKDLTTADIIAKTARQYFNPNAVVIKPLNDDTFEVIVGKPIASIVKATSEASINVKSSSLSWEDYNKEQQAAITQVADHINDVRAGKISNPFITIQGKAGTGKTTIVNEILKKMQRSKYVRPTVIMGALSHKATTVLKNKISNDVAQNFIVDNKTIAAMLGMRPQDDGSFAPIKGKEPPIRNASVVFIDEASMVNEEQLELVMEAIKGRRIPVVFLGDIGQLPPIRMSRYYRNSKISQDAPSPIFTDKNIPVAKLVTRVRQGEDSPVLDYADKYWNFSQDKRQEYPDDIDERSVVTDKGALIIQRNEVDLVKQLLPLFKEAKETRNPNLVKIVPYTNNSRDAKESAVDRYNRLIRKALYPNETSEGFFEGDLVIFNSGYGANEGAVPNSFEGSVISVKEVTEEIYDYKEIDLLPVKIQKLTIQGNDGIIVEVPALIPDKNNLKNHQRNIKALREHRNKVYNEGGNYGLAKTVYENYSNNFAANIGYAYAIDSHKSQGSTYEVVAVDVADINSVQPTSLKTKAQSTYTGLTRASNVTIVSSNTTNENTIYTNIKGINDRIKSVKSGTAIEEFTPETEEGSFSEIGKDDISSLIKDPNRKQERKRKKTIDDDLELDDYMQDVTIDMDSGTEAINFSDLYSEEEDEEESVKPEKTVKLNKQQQTYKDFVTSQKLLNSIIKFNNKDHSYTINGKRADYSVTQFRDFIYDENKEENDYLSISSRLGTTHDAILRDYFAEDLKSDYPNVTKSQIREIVKQAVKLERLLKKQYGENAIFITNENLLKIASKVTFDNKEYTVAGTMDMVVIDDKGNIHIVDFKTKRANIKDTLDDDKKYEYAFQLSLYKAMLESNPLFSDKTGKTYIAQFNILYNDPNRNEYSFEDQQVFIKVGNKNVKLQDAVIRGEKAYTPGIFHGIIGLSTELEDLKVKPINTALQEREESKKEEKKTNIEPKKFEAKMTNFFGSSKRGDIKAASPFGAIYEGKKTAMTKLSKKAVKYWKNAKIGDIITFTNNEGKKVKVRITAPLHKLDKDTSASEWSKKEGYSEDYFNENILPNINEAYQIEFELIKESPKSINITSRNEKYALLSNFGNKSFTINNNTFDSVEHYFQWRKAMFVKDYKMASAIKNAVSAKQAKYFGSHKLEMSEEQIEAWNKKSEAIMEIGMRAAFEQNEEAKELLLSTGSAELTHKLYGNSENTDPFADILMKLREEFGGKGKPIIEKSGSNKEEKSYKGVTKVISGAQTGVDTIGLEVAKELGLETGGTTTPNFVREKGIDSHTKESLESLGVQEISEELQGGKSGREFYLPRTEQNVINSDGTVYFATDKDSAGKIVTERFAKQYGKPFLLNPTSTELKKWLTKNKIDTLNVAGNRGSKLSNKEEIVNILKEGLSKKENRTEFVTRRNIQLKISTEGYKKGDPQRHPDINYVFTENAEAYIASHSFPPGEEPDIEFPYKEKPKLNVSDVNGTNQAGIRTDKNGNLSSNAYGIVVKKYQQDANGKFVAKKGQFQDTDEDFNLFVQLNEHMLESLSGSSNKKIIFPSQMGLGKAALPMRFVEWLQNQLIERFGIYSTVKKNTRANYDGYGLVLDSIIDKSMTPEEKAKAEKEEQEKIQSRLNDVNQSQQKIDKIEKLPEFQDDYFSIQQTGEKDDTFTGKYQITLNELNGEEDIVIDITNGSKDRELLSIVYSVPYSSVISLSENHINANFLYTLAKMLDNSTLHPVWGERVITIDPESTEGIFATEYAKESSKKGNRAFQYNTKTGELRIPVFTVGFTYDRILKRSQSNALFNNSLLSQEKLRNLSKAAIYKLSEFITMLQLYPSAYEKLFKTDNSSWEKDLNKDKDFTQMSRIQIIKEIGLSKLLFKVRERVFDSELKGPEFSRKTKRKLDIIFNNWNAFIELGYDTLIGLEEIALDNRGSQQEDIKNELNDVFDNESEDVIQEIFGSSVEHWQVGFRQVSAFNSLSQMIKRTMDSLYELDENGNQIINEFGIAKHLNAQEAVSKILYYTQGATSLDEKDDNGTLKQGSMLAMLKSRVGEEPWIQQIIDLLEGKTDDEGNVISQANEQFKSQFYSNFRKYFQRYAIISKDNKDNIRVQIINEHQYADTLVKECQAKETSFATGSFKLRTKEGKINQDTLAKLKTTYNTISKIQESLKKAGKIGELVDLNEYHAVIKEVLDLLDIATPADESLYRIFGVKKNFKTFESKLNYLLEGIKESKPITDMREYQQIVNIVAKEMGLEMEAVNYEAGKMYYSYVLPSYLGNLIGKLKGDNMSSEEYEEFLQNEYLRYKWFNRDGKIRNYWLTELKKSKTNRENFQHVTSLHYLGIEYSDKVPAAYIASMMRVYFYDDNKKWAYFRVPIMSNKPSEEYIKFKRLTNSTVGNYKEFIIDKMWDVFTQELDRIQAVRERQNTINEDQKVTSKGKKQTLDKNGFQFCFEDYLHQKAIHDKKGNWHFVTDISKDDLFYEDAVRFSELLDKKLSEEGLSEENNELAELVSLFNRFTERGFNENYQKAKQQWIDEGFITLDKEGNIKKIFGDMKLSEDDLQEFFWNDAFAAIQILELTITDTAYYTDTEDLQKRLAQLHAPGMRANINATYKGKPFTKDGIERTIYIKDDIVKSSSYANLKQAFEYIIADTPENQKEKLKEQLLSKDGILETFKKINFADAQGYNCPSSFRKKMGVFGNWDDKMESTYEKIVHPEKYPDVNLSDMLDIMLKWQPMKPFVFTNVSKPGYNDLLPEFRTGIQNKNSEYTLVLADALLRRTGIPNKLSAIYKFMEESQHDENGELNGVGIDTVQFMSAVNTGCTGVIDLNDTRDSNGNITHYKTEEEILQELSKVYTNDGYNPDYVHEILFEDYIVQQNVPAHFRDHYQAHGSQDRILTFSDMLDIDPVTKETNYLVIDGEKISVADAKKQYFQAIADNIDDSMQGLIKRFNLDALDRRSTNVAISEILKDAILKDSRFGSDLLWACDTNEYGEFNIPLSDPVHSNRIQQLLNSIIKNNINKQEIAGGPVVQVSNWGTSDQLNIRFKNSEGQLLLTEKEWNTQEFPKDFDAIIEKDGEQIEKWQQIEGYVDYKDYIMYQAGVAYFECYAPIQDSNIPKDFIKKDAEGNEYIDVEAMEKANPDLLNMIGYRIPTESKYSMAPLKIKGFLMAGEGIMLPAEITTLAGSDFDIDKLYMMRYTFNRIERNGQVIYEKPKSGRGYRDNLIISTQLAVLQSEQVQKQLFTPGNFDEPKKYGYLISYVQQEAKRTGRNPEEIYEEAKKMDADELKDLNMTSKNLIFNNIQVQFHKQNMTAGKLIGIFAQANVSHAFISLEKDTYLEIPQTISFTIDGINVSGAFSIDDTMTINKETYISNNLASLLAASVDAVKDPILNLININTNTANLVVAMLRMGFSIETVSLFCSQPVIKNLIKDFNIKNAESYADIQALTEQAINNMPEDIKSIGDIKVTTQDLIENLNGNNIITDYMVLQIFNQMIEISNTFMDITNMTRFNSITSAVGPFSSDTMILKTKVNSFLRNEMITDGIKLACGALIEEDPKTGILEYKGNPVLRAFREDAFAIERRLLGDNLIQASSQFEIALNTLNTKLGFRRSVPNKIANAFSDFYMSFYVNAGEEGSVFDLSFENRKYSLTEFPSDFLKLKSKYNNNILINSIQYVESNREQYPFLQIKTRGLSSTTLEDLKQAWISLYENDETRSLALRIAEYNFFRGSFGFNPKTFMNLLPNIIKSNLNNYIHILNEKDSQLSIDNQEMIDRVIYQFILHNSKLIIDNYKNIENYEPVEDKHPAYGDVITIERKPEANGKKKVPKPINTSRPFIRIDNSVYFVIPQENLQNSDTVTLKKVDSLGGDHQGFEISITEDFPTSIYDQSLKRKTQNENDEREDNSFIKIDDKKAVGILLDVLFQEDEDLMNIIEGSGKEAIEMMNKELENRGYEYKVSNDNRTLRSVTKMLMEAEQFSNPRKILNKAKKTLSEQLKDLCGG